MRGEDGRPEDGEGEGEEEQEGEEEEEEEDIVMPQGPRPEQARQEQGEGEEDMASEDSDGIVMPEGPPPVPASGTQESPSARPALPAQQPPLPPGPPPPHAFQWSTPLHGPPPPSHYAPPPLPSPRPAAPHGMPSIAYRPRQPAPPPHQQFATHPMASRPPSHLPPRPTAPGPPPPRPSAVISAAPVLRDLKKEATAFVPPALRKKQAAAKAQAAKGGLPGIVDAAPHADTDVGGSSTSVTPPDDAHAEKVDLMTSLRPHLPAQKAATQKEANQASLPHATSQGTEDYRNFLRDIGDLL